LPGARFGKNAGFWPEPDSGATLNTGLFTVIKQWTKKTHKLQLGTAAAVSECGQISRQKPMTTDSHSSVHMRSAAVREHLVLNLYTTKLISQCYDNCCLVSDSTRPSLQSADVQTRGATTFSKLGVQFLGLAYYYPSTEKIDRSTQFGAVGYIITLYSSKSYSM